MVTPLLFLFSFVNAAAFPTFPYVVLFAFTIIFRREAWWYFIICLVASVLGGILAYYASANHFPLVRETLPQSTLAFMQSFLGLLNQGGLVELLNPRAPISAISHALGTTGIHISWLIATLVFREGISFGIITILALIVSWPFVRGWKYIKYRRAVRKARASKAPSSNGISSIQENETENKKPTPEEELADFTDFLRTQRNVIVEVVDSALLVLTVQRVIASQIAEKHPQGQKGVQRRLETAGLQDFRAAESFLTDQLPHVMTHNAVQEIALPVVQDAMHLLVRYVCNDETYRDGIAELIDKVVALLEAADPKELQSLEQLNGNVDWIEQQPEVILAGAAFLLFFQSGLAKAIQDVTPHESGELAQKIKSDALQDGEVILHQVFKGSPITFTQEFPEAVEEAIGRLAGYLARDHNLSDLIQMRGLDIEEIGMFIEELGEPDETDPLKLACLPAPAFFFNKALIDLLCEDGNLDRQTVANALRSEFRRKSAKAISTAFKLIPKEEILGEADGLVAKMGASAALGVAKQVAKSVAAKSGDLIFSYVTREVPLDQIHTKMPGIIKLVQRFTGEPSPSFQDERRDHRDEDEETTTKPHQLGSNSISDSAKNNAETLDSEEAGDLPEPRVRPLNRAFTAVILNSTKKNER